MTFLTTAVLALSTGRSGRRNWLFATRNILRVGVLQKLTVGTNLRLCLLLLMVSYSFALIIERGEITQSRVSSRETFIKSDEQPYNRTA